MRLAFSGEKQLCRGAFSAAGKCPAVRTSQHIVASARRDVLLELSSLAGAAFLSSVAPAVAGNAVGPWCVAALVKVHMPNSAIHLSAG